MPPLLFPFTKSLVRGAPCYGRLQACRENTYVRVLRYFEEAQAHEKMRGLPVRILLLKTVPEYV